MPRCWDDLILDLSRTWNEKQVQKAFVSSLAGNWLLAVERSRSPDSGIIHVHACSLGLPHRLRIF
jgi:hypothetical protein